MYYEIAYGNSKHISELWHSWYTIIWGIQYTLMGNSKNLEKNLEINISKEISETMSTFFSLKSQV